MLTVYMHVLGQGGVYVFVCVFARITVCGTVKLGQNEVHTLGNMMQIQRNIYRAGGYRHCKLLYYYIYLI